MSLKITLDLLQIEDEPEEVETCPDCDGEGEIIDQSRISSRTIDVPYMKCPRCEGTGEIG